MKKPSSDIVALIQWIPRLTKTPIPGTMLDQLLGERSGPLSASNSANIDPEDLADMVQWSDLVIFDYLSGNYDRIASMMVSMMILTSFHCQFVITWLKTEPILMKLVVLH